MKPGRPTGPPPRRSRLALTLAVLVSLLMHGLLLSLGLGGQGSGLPGLALPWQERRSEAPDLQIVLVPARVAPPEGAAQLADEPAPAQALLPPPAPSMLTTPSLTALPAVPEALALPPAEPSRPTLATAADAALAAAPTALARPADPAPNLAPARAPGPEPAPVGLAKPADTTWLVPAVPEVSAAAAIVAAPAASQPTLTALPRASSGDAVQPQPQLAVQPTALALVEEQAAEWARFERARREAQQLAEQWLAASAQAARLAMERKLSR